MAVQKYLRYMRTIVYYIGKIILFLKIIVIIWKKKNIHYYNNQILISITNIIFWQQLNQPTIIQYTNSKIN